MHIPQYDLSIHHVIVPYLTYSPLSGRNQKAHRLMERAGGERRPTVMVRVGTVASGPHACAYLCCAYATLIQASAQNMDPCDMINAASETSISCISHQTEFSTSTRTHHHRSQWTTHKLCWCMIPTSISPHLGTTKGRCSFPEGESAENSGSMYDATNKSIRAAPFNKYCSLLLLLIYILLH